jgi:FkbM family methyltransferase
MFNQIKSLIKEAALKRLGIPYSKYGLPIMLMPYLNKNYTINLVDIGAHKGDFTDVVSKYVNISNAVLVEPIPVLAQYLKERFCSYSYHIFNCAISDKAGYAEFEINDAMATSSLLRINRDMQELSAVSIGNSNIIRSETRTLDNIIDETKIENVYLLKIDVQGTENMVLIGGKEILRRTSLVWVEVSFKPLYKNSCTFFEVYSIMYENDYILKGLSPAFYAPSGELLQADALFVKQGE